MQPQIFSKTFSKEDLLILLQNCAHNLDVAYQMNPDKTLFYTSKEAYRACDFLTLQILEEKFMKKCKQAE